MRAVPLTRLRWLVAVIAVAATVLGVAGAAQAATGITVTQPTAGARMAVAPSSLRIVFTAPIESHLAMLELWVHGHPVSLPAQVDSADDQVLVAAVPRRDVAPGQAWVRYRVITADGHVVRGRYAVQIGSGGPPSAAPGVPGSSWGSWLAGIGRGLLVTGLVVLLGLVVLRWGVTGAAWQQGGVVPPGRPNDIDAFRTRAAVALSRGGEAWWRVWWAALALWAIGALAYWLGLAAWAGTGWGGILALLGQTRTGVAVVVFVATAAGAAVAGYVAARGRGRAAPAPPIGWGIALGVWAVVGVLALSWQGHASDGTDAATNIPVDAVHALATAAWVGGLVGLLVLAVIPAAALADGDRVRLLASAVVRFSALAIVCVALLVVTGTYRALAELSSLTQLTDTAYGIALSVKLIVFAVMLIAGGYARTVLHPRLERAALGLDPDDRGAARALRHSLTAEFVLAAVLMVAVAVLLALTPPG